MKHCGECCVQSCDCFAGCLSCIFERQSLPDHWKNGIKLALFWTFNIFVLILILCADWLIFGYFLIPTHAYLLPRCTVGNYSTVCYHWDTIQIVTYTYLGVTILSTVLFPLQICCAMTEVSRKRWNPQFHLFIESFSSVFDDFAKVLLLCVFYYGITNLPNIIPNWFVYFMSACHLISVIWRIIKFTRLGLCCCMCTCLSTIAVLGSRRNQNKRSDWSWKVMRWVPGDATTFDWLSAMKFCCSSTMMAPILGCTIGFCVILLFLPTMASKIFAAL